MTPGWLESVYSDGSRYFVSDPAPKFGDTVTVWLRMYANAPVTGVILRSVPNGGDEYTEMELRKTERGLAWWAAELEIKDPRTHYQFYICTRDGVYYYSQRGVTTYIQDHSCDFVLDARYRQPSWVKNAVFYQIFPDRFMNGDPSLMETDEELKNLGPTAERGTWGRQPKAGKDSLGLEIYGGDLIGVREKIPYLKKLGVTAVYLNPIFTAPSSHKYDCIDYFHVDPHMGGDEALEELSKALHENGMRLILDISINHTGANHRWFNRDGRFFPKTEGAYNNPASPERGWYFFNGDGSYKCWFGVKNMPVLNYTSASLRDIIYRKPGSVIRKWLAEPYSIDGWRFDVADVFARNGEIQLAHEIWTELREAIRTDNPEGYILAEDWGDCTQYLQGTEWDSPMNYVGFGRVMRDFVGAGDLFMMRHPMLRASRRRPTAEDVEARVMEHLAPIPFALWQNQFNLLDSHDVPRLMNQPGVDAEEYRGAVIMQFTFIGAPSVYYGDEAEISGADETMSDSDCRHTMPWDKDIESTEQYKLINTLARLRTSSDALTEGGMKFLLAEGGLLSVARFTDSEAFVAVMSVENEDRAAELPLRAIGALKPKGDVDALGRALTYDMTSDGIAIRVPAHGAYLFECDMLDMEDGNG